METNYTTLLQDTEAFMQGELSNVTVANGRLLLDLVRGTYVPYGCYTSPVLTMPIFDALRMSWNACAPVGTVVEIQARIVVDGNWSGWFSFGRWSPDLRREGARGKTVGPVTLHRDFLSLEGKVATHAQMRAYLYTQKDKTTPTVSLLGCSVHALDVIPGGGRQLNARLHLMPYSVQRRAPALSGVMDLACSMASVTNRWGRDILPEELAIVLLDYNVPQGEDPRNLSFAAASVSCWGFIAWAGWGDLSLLRSEVRSGNGVVVALEATPGELADGKPLLRYVALRGFVQQNGESSVLLCDPWHSENDLECEISMPMDAFLVAWNNQALFLHPTKKPNVSVPSRESTWLHTDMQKENGVLYFMREGLPAPLPSDFAAQGGLLFWVSPDECPHATTAHGLFHFITPEDGGVRLPASEGTARKYTVYALYPNGNLLLADATL